MLNKVKHANASAEGQEDQGGLAVRWDEKEIARIRSCKMYVARRLARREKPLLKLKCGVD